jgi:DNA-binding NarL/FixJ family response regulator
MSYRVLVVDDSKLARMAVARSLSALRPDWIRLEASNAGEAADMAREADIALLDFNMPGVDGLAFAAELRHLRPAMPLAIISANNQRQIVDRAQAIGATFLPKPLTEDALRGFLDDAVQQIKAGNR